MRPIYFAIKRPKMQSKSRDSEFLLANFSRSHDSFIHRQDRTEGCVRAASHLIQAPFSLLFSSLPSLPGVCLVGNGSCGLSAMSAASISAISAALSSNANSGGENWRREGEGGRVPMGYYLVTHTQCNVGTHVLNVVWTPWKEDEEGTTPTSRSRVSN